MNETPERFTRALKRAGVLISVGLVVEAGSLYSLKALSFIAFAGGGALLVAVGILLYCLALVSH